VLHENQRAALAVRLGVSCRLAHALGSQQHRLDDF
jgi:hypothetical protein